jgi:hypothetical protein
MLKNQKTFLFDDSVSNINTSSNNSNVVHKQTTTTKVSNDNKDSLNRKISHSKRSMAWVFLMAMSLLALIEV